MSGSSLLRTALVLGVISWSTPLGVSAQADNQEVINRSDDPVLRSFSWRSIGPIGQGGRVDDIAVDHSNPHRYFVGFATGGLWRTVNNGTTFDPVFDTYATHSIGSVAIAPVRRTTVRVLRSARECTSRQMAGTPSLTLVSERPSRSRGWLCTLLMPTRYGLQRVVISLGRTRKEAYTSRPTAGAVGISS